MSALEKKIIESFALLALGVVVQDYYRYYVLMAAKRMRLQLSGTDAVSPIVKTVI